MNRAAILCCITLAIAGCSTAPSAQTDTSSTTTTGEPGPEAPAPIQFRLQGEIGRGACIGAPTLGCFGPMAGPWDLPILHDAHFQPSKVTATLTWSGPVETQLRFTLGTGQPCPPSPCAFATGTPSKTQGVSPLFLEASGDQLNGTLIMLRVAAPHVEAGGAAFYEAAIGQSFVIEGVADP